MINYAFSHLDLLQFKCELIRFRAPIVPSHELSCPSSTRCPQRGAARDHQDQDHRGRGISRAEAQSGEAHGRHHLHSLQRHLHQPHPGPDHAPDRSITGTLIPGGDPRHHPPVRGPASTLVPRDHQGIHPTDHRRDLLVHLVEVNVPQENQLHSCRLPLRKILRTN